MTALTFALSSTRFDEDYRPAASTRITTNFANLARGDDRERNLRNTLAMIDHRVNALAHWDNPTADRYSVELEIISASVDLGGTDAAPVPIIEVLLPTIVDHASGRRIEGIVGNNFSSYVRDYDFSVVLPAHQQSGATSALPDDFGVLHGTLFEAFLQSDAYTARFAQPPVICLSVSTSQTYERTANRHPILGVEYRPSDFSLTDAYFATMGLSVRCFMPEGSVAPLAFYHRGDLTGDYGNLELIATIGTMETFQRIYRPEIYNANAAAGAHFRASLTHADYSTTRIVYDREERSRLAVEQGRFVDEHFITPHRAALEQWSADWSAQHPNREGAHA